MLAETEQDGLQFEKDFMSMVGRFRGAECGVDAADVELALAADAAGDNSLLNAILSRQVTSRI